MSSFLEETNVETNNAKWDYESKNKVHTNSPWKSGDLV